MTEHLYCDPYRYTLFTFTDDDEEYEDEDDGNDSDDEQCEVQRQELREGVNGHPTELREEMYRQKLSELRSQLQQLHTNTLPEYVRRLRRLEAVHRERQRLCHEYRGLEMEMVESELNSEVRAVASEFEEQKLLIRESFMSELKEKRRSVEADRTGLEITGDYGDQLKAVTTRKLRRRANEIPGEYTFKTFWHGQVDTRAKSKLGPKRYQ